MDIFSLRKSEINTFCLNWLNTIQIFSLTFKDLYSTGVLKNIQGCATEPVPTTVIPILYIAHRIYIRLIHCLCPYKSIRTRLLWCHFSVLTINFCSFSHSPPWHLLSLPCQHPHAVSLPLSLYSECTRIDTFQTDLDVQTPVGLHMCINIPSSY